MTQWASGIYLQFLFQRIGENLYRFLVAGPFSSVLDYVLLMFLMECIWV